MALLLGNAELFATELKSMSHLIPFLAIAFSRLVESRHASVNDLLLCRLTKVSRAETTLRF